MRFRQLCFGFLIAAIFTAPMALAQESPLAEQAVMLPCEGKCPTITRRPVKLSGTMRWPASVLNGPMVEGLVELHFTLGADGHVGDDVTAQRSLGPSEFVEMAKRGIRDFVYQPALVDGEPAAVPSGVLVLYVRSGQSTGGRRQVTVAYRRAALLFEQHKLDEAEAILAGLLGQPRLVFYERGLIASLQSLIALERKDFVRARELTDAALIFPEAELTPAISRILLQSAVTAALELNDIVGVRGLLDHLARIPATAPADVQVAALARLRQKVDSMASFGAPGAIPAADTSEAFGLGLYRRHFAFRDVKGELKSLSVRCSLQEATSPFSPNAEWSIPKTWGDCCLLVRGAPGTTFQIVQYSSPPSADAAAATQMVATHLPMP